MDFTKLRQEMVETQIVERGIKSAGVIEAMREIPRHEFAPDETKNRAYEDAPVYIGEGQTMSQPYMVALMTQSLNLNKIDKVLEIGTGSGYQTAVLAEMSDEVYTVERNSRLSQRARLILDKMGYTNIRFHVGDGTQAWPQGDLKFDAVLVTAASPKVPDPLWKQLTDRGRIVIPLGDRTHQTLWLLTKSKSGIKEEKICSCVFVPLIGEHGWN